MNDKISENPSFKKLEDGLRSVGCASQFMPWILNKSQRQELQHIKDDLDELRNMPDRFNSLYIERGWVCFGGMNAELVKRCVELGENGELDKAEQILVEYYKGDIRYLKYPLRNTPGFKERYDLLQKALEDYANSRYHSCVPIFLMIIDGAVNQVLKKNQGLFAQDVDLILYDSVIGHKNGLKSLIQLMSKNRKKTTLEPIYIPFRNGILHGMDVCYDNELVATKALTTLFAVAEWIRHFCNQKYKDQPKEEEARNIKSIFKELKELSAKAKQIDAEKALLNEWGPRIFTGVDFLVYSPVEGTPEYTILKFFELCQNANYGKMAELVIDYSGKSVSDMAGKIRSWLGGIKCMEYHIVDIVDNTPAISEILLSIKVSASNEIKEFEIKSRLIYQADRTTCSPLVRGQNGGEWYVMESLLFDISYKIDAAK